jgi:hypothetical protein
MRGERERRGEEKKRRGGEKSRMIILIGLLSRIFGSWDMV